MKLNLLKIDRLVIMGSILLIFSSLLALIVPLSLRNVIDGGAMQSMFMNSVTVALLFIGQALLASLGNYLFSRSGEAKIAAARMQVTNHLLYAKKSFFDQSKSGELASRIVNDTSGIREFLITTFPDLITSLVLIIGAVFVLFSLDWQLSLVLLLSLPLMLLFVIPLANIGGKYTRCMQDEVSVLTGNLTEKFREIEMIKTSQEEEKVQNQLLRNIKNTQHISVKGDLIASFESPFALLFIFATVALIFTYGGQRVATGSLTVGTLVSFLIYLFQLLNPVSSLSNFLTAYARMKGAVSSLEELLLVEQENLGDGGQASGDNLVFDNVSFSYDGHHPVLSDINLTIFKGQKVAFVGPSGSGKTTLARLVERFYEPNQGKILLDNQSISVFQLKDWRRRIAWVSQNDAVLSGTIRENLCFGIFSDVSDEQLFFALD